MINDEFKIDFYPEDFNGGTLEILLKIDDLKLNNKVRIQITKLLLIGKEYNLSCSKNETWLLKD